MYPLDNDIFTHSDPTWETHMLYAYAPPTWGSRESV